MLRRRLILPAAAIALVLGVALTGVGYWTGRTIVSALSGHLVREAVDGVVRDAAELLDRPQGVLSWLAADIAQHDVPLDDPHAVLRELAFTLRNQSSVDWLFFGNPGGGDVAAGRLADGMHVFLMTDGFRPGVMRQYDASPDGRVGPLRKSGDVYDARQRPWYKQANDSHALYWSEPYFGSSVPGLGISLSTPVLNKDGRFAGVIGAELLLTRLSMRMQNVTIGETGRAFIIDSAGQLIASSGGVMPVAAGNDGTQLRVLASNADDPIVRGTARYLRTRPEILGQLPKAGPQAFSISVPGIGEIHAAAERLPVPSAFSWTVIAALPASDFLGPARYALFLSIALSVFLVALAWLLGFWTVRLALRPLTTLTQAARSISRGEWPDLPEVQRNDEIGVLARAFRLMTGSLKDTQDGLRRSEENYRSIFENAPEGIVRSTPDGRVLSANPALAQRLGYASPEQLIAEARNLREQVWADSHAHDEALSILLCDGAINSYEAEFRRKDGQRIWVLLSGHLVHDSSDEPSAIETFVRDISDRKRADEALHHARAELARITRVATLGETTASIAHEIRQPLTAIVTNAYACLRWLATQPPSVEEARQSVDRIVRDGHRADGVMQRIRALFKNIPSRREWLSVNDLIIEAVTLTRSEADRNHVSLTTELSNDLPRVKADRIQLQQVIVNLIMNAIEAVSAVEEGPREVLVSSTWDGSQAVLLAVRDTGTGLDPGQFDQVFDAFYTTKLRGMGMGLTISRSIVEAHGGRLWASANTARGAVFQFVLQAEGEEAVSQSEPERNRTPR